MTEQPTQLPGVPTFSKWEPFKIQRPLQVVGGSPTFLVYNQDRSIWFEMTMDKKILRMFKHTRGAREAKIYVRGRMQEGHFEIGHKLGQKDW